ncbi:MAG TPA: proline dehydrogenase family protein, partial [Elusimicrobiota bacterium]|nr:proline dehydrogenase family protein [Elusimicrobiota bacterium]
AVQDLNKRGLSATLDFLGEDCANEAQAQAAADEILGLLRGIHERKLDSNVSLKLTQLGFNLSRDLAKRHLEKILDEAKRLDNFIRIDMEGSEYTQSTVDVFLEVFRDRKNVGTVLQSYLKRTPQDVEALIKAGARVRLVKGAYKEPPAVAFQSKEEVNAQYDVLARRLLEAGNYPAIATHDEDRVQAALAFIKEKGIAKDRFEFQMLYGLRPGRWAELRADGYKVRIYVPYGTHWFPYFVRRLRERKENWMFVVKNLVKG